MQFGFMSGGSTIEAIFILRQVQEKFIGTKRRDFYFAFLPIWKKISIILEEKSFGW